MSIPDINSLRDELLIELASRKATNGNPGNVAEICRQLRPEINWQSNADLARSSGWLLVRNDPPLAKKVMDSEKPGAMLLALTAEGKAAASKIFETIKPRTFFQKLEGVPRSDWIALGAFIVSLIALFK